MFGDISAWFSRRSNWRIILVVALLYQVFLLQVMAPHAEEMQRFAGDWGAPDGHFYYTPDKLYAELGAWDEAGRSHYINFRLSLDPVWALLYTAFLVVTISVCTRRLFASDSRVHLLNLLPLLPMLADLTENFLGIVLVANLPARLDALAMLTAVITATKWSTLVAAHILMLLLVVCAVWAELKERFLG
jgi:hypothetical protein